MNADARVVFIQSQILMMHAEMQGMIATNEARKFKGQGPLYTGRDFVCLSERWDNILGHNAVIEYLRD